MGLSITKMMDVAWGINTSLFGYSSYSIYATKKVFFLGKTYITLSKRCPTAPFYVRVYYVLQVHEILSKNSFLCKEGGNVELFWHILEFAAGIVWMSGQPFVKALL